MAITSAQKLEGMIIGGEEVPAAAGGVIEDRNPANGEVLATVASAGAADVDHAVNVAAEAFTRTWQRTRPAERGRVLVRISAAIRARADEIARMECLDTGKPLRQAKADTEVAARYFEFYGGAADKILGSTIPLGSGFLDYTVREPLGVSAHIVPWNYPLQILGRGVAADLAAGNTVVLKPASQAPLTALTIGPGIEDPDIGPLITDDQRRRVLDYVALGRREGAELRYGGKAPDDGSLSKGSFLEPTLLDGVSNEMRVAQEEIFGPVLVVIPFDEVEEAAAISNDSRYGLLAGIWTRDINKALALAERIQSGQVYINTYGAGGGAELPFGGYKQSGFGREKGLEGLLAYTQVKNVCVRYTS